MGEGSEGDASTNMADVLFITSKLHGKGRRFDALSNSPACSLRHPIRIQDACDLGDQVSLAKASTPSQSVGRQSPWLRTS